jgi:CTP:molybdopterin cytidylyltransferase MocA
MEQGLESEQAQSMSLPPVIMLAAGESSRMKQPKGLLRLDGELWVIRQFKALKAAGITQAFLVLGEAKEDYFTAFPPLEEALASFRKIEGLDVRSLVNAAPENGQFSSIQLGLSVLEDENDAFILPIDVPAAQPKTWSSLFEEFLKEKALLVALPEYKKIGGHPILLRSSYIETLLNLPPAHARLDREFHKLDKKFIRRLECNDPAVTLNLNDQTAWQNFAAGEPT